MKKIITSIAAGLLIIGAQSVMADSTTNSPAETPTVKHHAGGADRAAVLKILGLSKEDLKDLTPKEQHAKVKEAADKYVADMKEKKASGSLTDEQKHDLAKVQGFLAHSGHKKAAAATPAPAQ